MPIPNPQSGESQSEFVSRCIGEIRGEYPQDQAAAICYNKYTENMNTESKVLNRIKKFREEELKGINLNEDGSVNLEEPCWKNYRQYGTKIVDGREVPNCVGPIEGVD
jgi:hypothetical protein